MRPINRLLCLLLASASLSLSLPARADDGLAAAIDTTITKLKQGDIRNMRILWGPEDSNISAAIAAAPVTTQDKDLLSAVQTARLSGVGAPPTNPFATGKKAATTTTQVDLLTAIDNARSNPNGVTCVRPLVVGSGAYLDGPLCVGSSQRDSVRQEILKQSGWQLTASTNNTDQATTPDGFSVVFIYNAQGYTRQALVLINAAQ